MKVEYFPMNRSLTLESQNGADLVRIGIIQTKCPKAYVRINPEENGPFASRILEVSIDDVLTVLVQ